jgi:hydrogenase maturation protease
LEKLDNINTIILGTGNILLGDEGIGVHIINRLKEEELPQGVLVVDGSTAGFRLMSIFESYKNCKFIIIDALKITSGVSTINDTNYNT